MIQKRLAWLVHLIGPFLVLIGIYFLYVIYQGIKLGKLTLKSSHSVVELQEQPFVFWFFIGVFLSTAVAAIYGGILLIRDSGTKSSRQNA